MFSGFSKFYSILISVGSFLEPFFLLAIRLFWGWHFFNAGLTKFEDMEKVGTYFGTIGIPLPLLSAYLVATVEMVGGIFLFLGLASRLVSIPLMITMGVALWVANYEVTSKIFEEPLKILSLDAFTFLMAALTIFVFGPGMFSMDAAIRAEERKP
jgi:putative oxidoreductase